MTSLDNDCINPSFSPFVKLSQTESGVIQGVFCDIFINEDQLTFVFSFRVIDLPDSAKRQSVCSKEKKS